MNKEIRKEVMPTRPSAASLRSRTESETSGRYGDEDYGGKERAPLSPVSEDPCEDDMMDDEDDAMMYEDIIETGAPAPPDGGWGWVIVFASFMCNLIVDGIAYTFGVFLSKFDETFQQGPSKVAWVGSLLCGMYLLVGPIVSALTNKFGCRVVCISGSVVGCLGFALSSLSPSLEVLMLTYGVIGGIGFGLIYLPAVVCVGYYFESKRAVATGIAVAGSGVGTFVFAPFAAWLLEQTDWRNANLVLAGLIFCCAIFGALMRPLQVSREDYEDVDSEYIENGPNGKPLLQRMAEDKRNYMDKGSLAGSAYFMVQLPDGTMERRMKMPLNVDPGVHSTFNLDQLVGGPGTPVPNANTTTLALPTITEAKATDGASGGSGSDGSREGSGDLKSPNSETKEKVDGKEDELRSVLSTTPAIPIPIPDSISEENENDGSYDSQKNIKSPLSASVISANRRSLRERRNSDGIYSTSPKQAELMAKSPPRAIPIKPVPSVGSRMGGIPRNGSAPQFTPGRSIPKNVSVPLFDRMPRRHSYRAVPIGTAQRNNSKPNLQDTRRGSNQFKTSMTSFMSSKNNNVGANQDDDYNSLWSKGELSEGLIFSTSQKSHEPRHIIRPLSRKDIFYSGSIAALPEFQSQKSLTSYRQSVLNIPKLSGMASSDDQDGYPSPEKSKPVVCPCLLYRAGAFKSALAQLMDFSLIKNPVFLFIAVSNIFGMLGFYVPFVYIISAALEKGVEKEQAAFLLSIIGITNTIGRVVCGVLSDLPQVNSLFMNNMCILLSGLCIAIVPFCPNYYAFVGVAIFFGLFVSGYVSLTSIILVDLLGLENLTNAFGLLILFRGAASIVGAPLAGFFYEAFQNYDVPFFIAGGFLIISALISFMIPFIIRFAPPKPQLEPPRPTFGMLEDIPEAAETGLNNSTEFDEKYDPVESSV